MTSKKTAASKRTNLPRVADYTKLFLKDWERLSHSGKHDMNRLKEVMLMLINNNGSLSAEWLDHQLIGNWEGYRECHIGGDFLLMYKLNEKIKVSQIVFVRTGTHADLFE